MRKKPPDGRGRGSDLNRGDALLLLLSVAAGSADGWSYFGLGHAFVANMTGNTVLLGTAVFLHRDLLHPAISLVCYAAGTAFAAYLTRKARESGIWPRPVCNTLALESAILLAAAMGWGVAGRARALPGSTSVLDALLGCVAFAIGMQSGAMLQLRIPGIVTTYITGTWTSLVRGLTRFLSREEEPLKEDREMHEARMTIQAAILGAYLLSAVATGALFRYARLTAGALPALSLLFVAVYAREHRPVANA